MTPPGLYDGPDKITADEIRAASAAGRENDILDLGPHSNGDVEQAAATGDPRVKVTERQPDGTEVKTSTATAGTAPDQAATMEATKTPGNTVGNEPIADVVKQREDSILRQTGYTQKQIDSIQGLEREEELKQATAQGYKPEPDKASEEAPRGIDAVIRDRQDSILRQYGWTDNHLAKMGDDERASEVEDALASGVSSEPAAPQAARPKGLEKPKTNARYDALHAKVQAGEVRDTNGKPDAVLQVAQSIKYVNGDFSRDELKDLVRRYDAIKSNGAEREAALWQIVRDFSNPGMFNAPETFSIVDAHGLMANVHVVRGKESDLDSLFVDDGGGPAKIPNAWREFSLEEIIARTYGDQQNGAPADANNVSRIDATIADALCRARQRRERRAKVWNAVFLWLALAFYMFAIFHFAVPPADACAGLTDEEFEQCALEHNFEFDLQDQ